MRRLLLSIFTFGFFLGMLTGCGRNFVCHTAGVCDCDSDDDPCAHRAPWARGMGSSYSTVGTPSAANPNGVPITATTVSRTSNGK